MAHGSNMQAASDWAAVVALLDEELESAHGGVSIEEGVIRCSIKAIPGKLRGAVTQLFHGFALVPEDTHVPLGVLGNIFDACNPSDVAARPVSRLRVRHYLKVLLDRNLVLGTVDRPQLHDVMLDYVTKQIGREMRQTAQRKFVELVRKGDRSTVSSTGIYIRWNILHHIKEACDEQWAKGSQAISWVEDHVNGVQDSIAFSAASLLPIEALAEEAEAACNWWRAGLRWHALARMTMNTAGIASAGYIFLRKAADATAKVVIGGGSDVSQNDVNLFDVHVMLNILTSWNPSDVGVYGGRLQTLMAETNATKGKPMHELGIVAVTEWFPPIAAGNVSLCADACWKMIKMMIGVLHPETAETAANATGGSTRVDLDDEETTNAKVFTFPFVIFSADILLKCQGFDPAIAGEKGDRIVDYFNAYVFEKHHPLIIDIFNLDPVLLGSEAFFLTLQFGRARDSIAMLSKQVEYVKKVCADPTQNGYSFSIQMSCCVLGHVLYMHGQHELLSVMFAECGMGFDTSYQRVVELCPSFGDNGSYISIDSKGTSPGLLSTRKVWWYCQCLLILNGGVSDSDAQEFLRLLPDDEEFLEWCLSVEGRDHDGVRRHDHSMMGNIAPNFIFALACEKVGRHDDALRFADLQVAPVAGGGNPEFKWGAMAARSCKGRVFAKLGRQEEALAAFQAAVDDSKESFPMIQAFAYRELANYKSAPASVVAQANASLEATLDGFEGRLTRAEFGILTLGVSNG